MRGIYEGLMLYQTLFVVILFRILQGMGFHDLKVSFLIRKRKIIRRIATS